MATNNGNRITSKRRDAGYFKKSKQNFRITVWQLKRKKLKEEIELKNKTNIPKQLRTETNIFCRFELLVKRFFAPLGKEL